jgi:hypothetical protein
MAVKLLFHYSATQANLPQPLKDKDQREPLDAQVAPPSLWLTIEYILYIAIVLTAFAYLIWSALSFSLGIISFIQSS